MSELRYTVAMPPGAAGGKWTLTPQAQHPVGSVIVALPYSGEITAGGVLVAPGGTVPPSLPASVPGEDATSPEYLLELSMTRDGRQIAGKPLRLRMVETSPGVVDVAALLRSGGAVAVTPEQLADLTTAKQEARAAAQSVTDATLDLTEERQKVTQALVDTAQTTEEMRTVAAVRSLGREPRAGDPAGTYRMVRSGELVDVAWDGAAETGATDAVASLSRVLGRTAVNLGDVPGSGTAALTAALAAMRDRGATRLDLPDGVQVITQTVTVDHDLHLRGTGGADWLNSDPAGSVLEAGGGVANMLRIIGHPYRNPATGVEYPQTRIGAYSFDGQVYQGEGGVGGRVTNAAHRYEVGNGPVRPVSYNHVTFRGFMNAIDVQVAEGSNTGIGQVTFNNVTFTGCDNALRSRGNNGILQATFLNVTMEQGARIDVEQGDPAGGPGAMGGWQFVGGQFEGQNDAIKIHGGSWQFFMAGAYFEHNTGRTLDLSASSPNSSATIHNLHVEHDPINVYLAAFGRVDVDTHPSTARVHVAYNGARSRYHGMPVIPTVDAEGICLTLAEALDAASYGGATQPSATYFDRDIPDAPYPLRVDTPLGPLGAAQVGDGIGGYSFASLAVTTAQTLVVTALARRVSGTPALGYVVINGNTGAVISNRASLLLLDDDWCAVLLALTPTANVPSVKWAWQVGDGEAEITEAHCAVVPAGTPVYHWRPRGAATQPNLSTAGLTHPAPTRTGGVAGTTANVTRAWLGSTPTTLYGQVSCHLTVDAAGYVSLSLPALAGYTLVGAEWSAASGTSGVPVPAAHNGGVSAALLEIPAAGLYGVTVATTWVRA